MQTSTACTVTTRCCTLQPPAWLQVLHACNARQPPLKDARNDNHASLSQFRYTLLCLAGLEAPLQLELDGRAYGDNCIFIANDWHASMVPVYLAAKYRPGGVYRSARSVLAIHNLRHQVGRGSEPHMSSPVWRRSTTAQQCASPEQGACGRAAQGVFPPTSYAGYGLPGEWYGALEWQYPPHQRQGSYEEEGRAVNTLKVRGERHRTSCLGGPAAAWHCALGRAGWHRYSLLPMPLQGGISTADRIVTVSPGYAWEVQTPEGGWGMEQMLRSRAYALNGVLNGIDNQDWNPATDKHLEHKFGTSNFSRGKVRAPGALSSQEQAPGALQAQLLCLLRPSHVLLCRP